ncbi:TonB-dependent siderophore receptor [Dyella sp. C9]|uniref:TonB-dependent siderophore receptor n=1 Tax=Dyella sp. C9 TaxID=2202154 RepID=UPI0018E58FBF|nr:TonB-dependent siderophore receptor [Dyella sp. C9]
MESRRTSRARPVGRRHAFRAALFWPCCTATALAACATNVAAADSTPARRYDIGAGSLPEALARFERQSGVTVDYDAKLVAGKPSPGLHGSYDAAQALATLLSNSGLQASLQANGHYALGAVSSTGDARAKTLAGVTVVGQAGAVGYVAGTGGSATKTDTPLIETPQSISVVTRQQLDDQQPQSLNEALRYSPGVIPESEGTVSNFWGANSLQLRGFTPGVFLDGLQDDTSANAMVDPYFYQSVEVLSGPASVLYGQASPGGIVNMVSKQPTDTPLHEVTLGIGNYDRYQAGFDFGGPLDQEGHWLYRLTGVGLTQDTQTDWIEHKRYGIAPAITWRPSDDTRLTLLGNFTYSPAMGDYSSVPAVGSVLYSPLGKISSDFSPGDPNFNKATQRLGMVGYQFEHRFNDHWEFEQNARFTDNRNEANMIWPSDLEADGATLDRYAFVRHMSARSYLIDNRFKTQFDLGSLKNDVLMGANYSKFNENWQWGTSFDVPPINIFNPVYGVPVQAPDPSTFSGEVNHAHQTGVYLQDQISLDRWRFLLGVRQDWIKENQTSGDPSLVIADQPDHKFTWRAGLVYLFDNGLAPYASYSTSFQPQFGSITSAGTAATPTTGQQYEAGLKFQPSGSSSLITLAVYNLTEQNVPETDPQNPNFVVQVGEIRSRGVELSDRTSLTDNLNLIASYTYTDSRYTRTPAYGTAYSGVTLPVQGNYQYGVPRQAASLWADYTLHETALKGLGFSGGVRYIGSSYGDNVNSFKVPAFTLVDAAVKYDLGAADAALHGLKLQLNVANLLDKSYVSACDNTLSCNFGVRRTVYASATYDW